MLSYISNWSALGALRVTETAESNHRVSATIPMVTVRIQIHASCLVFIPCSFKPKVHYADLSETCPRTCLEAGSVCSSVSDRLIVSQRSRKLVANLFDAPLTYMTCPRPDLTLLYVEVCVNYVNTCTVADMQPICIPN